MTGSRRCHRCGEDVYDFVTLPFGIRHGGCEPDAAWIATESIPEGLPVDYPHCTWLRYGLKSAGDGGDPDLTDHCWREECRAIVAGIIRGVVLSEHPVNYGINR
jgi:hypothetical protein